MKRFAKGEDVESYLVSLSSELANSAPLTALMAGVSTPTTTTFVAPRLTTAQRDALVGPSSGMIILNTTTGDVNVHDGTAWRAIAI